VLMPPEQQQPQPTLPSGPGGSLDPDYKFIFEDKKKPRFHFRLGLPKNNNFAKTVALVVGGGIVLIILIIAASSFFGARGVNSKQLVDIMARAQEISRVSNLVSQQQQNVDPNTLNLAATTSSALSSEQTQLLAYLHKARARVSTKALNFYLNKNTDTQLQTATESNNFSTTYYAYLKTNLGEYQNALKTIIPGSPPMAQAILNDALTSTQTLLAAPQLASAVSQ